MCNHARRGDFSPTFSTLERNGKDSEGVKIIYDQLTLQWRGSLLAERVDLAFAKSSAIKNTDHCDAKYKHYLYMYIPNLWSKASWSCCVR